ncbi:flavodoxin family protein [Elusimicrobiota bacterium]
MKIIAFNGSHKGEKGNTHIMVTEFLKGAQEAGAETENVILIKKKINRCAACFTCWTKTPGKCAQKDDMAGLLAKMEDVDIIVFATPLYIDNVSAVMKNFMDRMVPDVDAHFEKDENGEYRHARPKGEVPRMVVISNCGFPEQTHFQVLSLLFKRIARNTHTQVIAEIYRGGGELLSVDSVMIKLLTGKYKSLLRKAGKEVVKNMQLSNETRVQLEKPIISHERYIKAANSYWDKELAKNN